MLILVASLLLSLTVQLQDSIENLELIVTNTAGAIVGQLESPTAGEYVFDQLNEGRYTLRAELDGVVMAVVREIDVPTTEPIAIRIRQQSEQQEAEARRNQNIQVNLVDNQALDEALERQGAQVRPIPDFSATRGNYAAVLGGIGRDPQIARTNPQTALQGQIHWTHNNSAFNARTFFQVGDVLPSRLNQYGFRLGGPLGSKKLSFVLSADENRESGFVNGNVRVPLPSERTALAENPQLRTLIQTWLDAYPKELPNRTEIDVRMLNTNAIQKIRNSSGTFRLDWEPDSTKRFSVNYSISDLFIDSFELVVGQNPNQ